MKSTRVLIGITIAFLSFMTYANVGVWIFSNPLQNSYYLPWGFVSILLEMIGFTALRLLLRKRKREKIETGTPIKSDSLPRGNQPQNEEPSRITPPKEKEPDYSLDDSKLK